MKTPPSRTLLETADAAAQQIFLSMLLGYYAMVRKLVDLFSRMAELDGKLSRLYQSLTIRCHAASYRSRTTGARP